MNSEFNYKGPLRQWVETHNKIEDGVEVQFSGKYYFKVEGRLYYIDLRCSAGDLYSLHFFRLFTHFKTGEDFHEDIFYYLIEAGIFDYNPDIEPHEYTTEDFRGLCEIFVMHYAVKYNARIKTLEKGRKLIDDDYWNGMGISSYDKTAEYMPWQIIDECGRIFRNKRILITCQTCPKCGSPIVKSKYSTSIDTWINLAGREGWIWFCPECKEQIQERITVMN